ncbi:MAG: 3-phosphoshikimate 1-carboxyvinyltransferase [Armatimonadetes bacterium]|nr:3-phosphoshikimate 1-carboxyvinyltransferase [Armatimonadota bacterium]
MTPAQTGPSPATLTVPPARRLSGRVRVPGDKSISHRAALLGVLAEGKTVVEGFLRAADCLSTLRCLRHLGAEIRDDGERLTIQGLGLGGLVEADDVLDVGNSGTTMRLLAGILAGQPYLSVLTGDASIRRRPMDRVAVPLRQMGASIQGRRGGRLAPLVIQGGRLRAIDYALPVASAQVKSAVLLAGLFADGPTTVREPAPTRDHTERMLQGFGADLRQEDCAVTLYAPTRLLGTSLSVPGDISSAAFFLVAAAALPGSELAVEGVGLNPTRTGALDALRAMGARVEIEDQWISGGEPVGTVVVHGGALRGIEITGPLIPRLIDELPVLCVAAAVAEGTTEIRDAGELRVKESDRIVTLAANLRALGAAAEELSDGIIIRGGRLRGGRVPGHGDHRIAMACAVAGLLAAEPVTVEGAECIDISFPEFHRIFGDVAVG